MTGVVLTISLRDVESEAEAEAESIGLCSELILGEERDVEWATSVVDVLAIVMLCGDLSLCADATI